MRRYPLEEPTYRVHAADEGVKKGQTVQRDEKTDGIVQGTHWERGVDSAKAREKITHVDVVGAGCFASRHDSAPHTRSAFSVCKHIIALFARHHTDFELYAQYPRSSGGCEITR